MFELVVCVAITFFLSHFVSIPVSLVRRCLCSLYNRLPYSHVFFPSAPCLQSSRLPICILLLLPFWTHLLPFSRFVQRLSAWQRRAFALGTSPLFPPLRRCPTIAHPPPPPRRRPSPAPPTAPPQPPPEQVSPGKAAAERQSMC